MKRRIYKIQKAGSIDNLRIEEEELATPGEDEVLVKVHAIGLNFADIFALQGLYSATPKGAFIPGLEFSGEILEVGPKVEELPTGTRVFGVIRFGAYASHVIVNKAYVSVLPQDWEFADGAAYPVQALTAYYALKNLGSLQPKQKVLIHSAAGGVGIWANRIAHKLGGITIGIVGSNKKMPVLEEEGFHYSLVRSPNMHDEVLQMLGGERPEIILECIGGKIFKESYRLMAEQGRMITYGAAHFGNKSARPNKIAALVKYLRRPRIDPMNMMRENKSVMGFNLIWLFDKTELFNDSLKEMAKLNLQKPRIGHLLPFDQMLNAIRLFQTGTTTGKVVLEVKH